jgi:cytoskeletal protein CcmA (bactofilin family)
MESAAVTPAPVAPTLIATDTTIEGRVLVGTALVVQGRVVGAVVPAELAVRTEVRIVAGAVVEGEVRADVVSVDGHVHGNLTGAESVRLGSAAVVIGDVAYGRLDMEMDARVDGRLVELDRPELSNVVPIKP